MVRDKVVTDLRSSNFIHQSNALCTLLVSAVIEFSRVHADTVQFALSCLVSSSSIQDRYKRAAPST